jgi:hypothetical protein
MYVLASCSSVWCLQVGRLAQRMLALQQRRAADREHVDRQAQFRMQVRVVPAAEADRHVVVVAGEVRRAGIRGHADVDLRVRLDEAVQPRDQPLHREGRRDVHAQHRREFGAELPGGVGEHAEGLLHGRQVGAAGGGQGQRLGFAQEQRHAQVLFERLHLVAHGRRRDEQFLGCLGEARMPGCDLERPQGVQRGKIAGHGGCIVARRGRLDFF